MKLTRPGYNAFIQNKTNKSTRDLYTAKKNELLKQRQDTYHQKVQQLLEKGRVEQTDMKKIVQQLHGMLHDQVRVAEAENEVEISNNKSNAGKICEIASKIFETNDFFTEHDSN